MARNQLSRGEIWLIDLGLAQKHRPAVIMSVAYLDHERALVAYVPRTTSLRGSRFEVAYQAQYRRDPLFQAVGDDPGSDPAAAAKIDSRIPRGVNAFRDQLQAKAPETRTWKRTGRNAANYVFYFHAQAYEIHC
jgi:hypothetical protein